MIPLSVVILTKNEEANLPACLESVSWAEEIVVVDDGSVDATVRIALRFNARIYERKMDLEGKQRNFAYSKATQDWVLSLDADERVNEFLRKEIENVVKGSGSISGYAVPIKTYIGKRWIQAAGYYPATRLRLFKKGAFRFEEAGVHPRAFLDGARGFLKGDIIHYGYRNISHFLEKLNGQTTLEAVKWNEDRRHSSALNTFRKMSDRLMRNYFGKKGVTDGFLGFFMSVCHGLYQYWAYRKYLELKDS